MNQIISLWGHLRKARKCQLWLVLGLMILTSFLEVLGVGLVVPFLSVLVAPEYIYEHRLVEPFNEILGITAANQLILPLTGCFISAIIFSGSARIILNVVTNRISYGIGADLSIDIFRRTLHQDYSVHLSRNSSEVVNGMINKTDIVTGGVISPILRLISSLFLLVGILSVLIVINPWVAGCIFMGFSFLYICIFLGTRKHLKHNSQIIADKSTHLLKVLQEGLGGIRDVLIDARQDYFCILYRDLDISVRKASADNAIIRETPRYFLESIGVSLIAILAYFILVFSWVEPVQVIPVLGAFAMGAQRLLPALQQGYAAISTIKSSSASLQDVLDLLKQTVNYDVMKRPFEIIFEKEINFKHVYFRYGPNGPWVLEDMNFCISKGERIGFIGETGSGKSTTIDVLMGLLPSSKGVVEVDGQPIMRSSARSWQKHIAHVPQNIFLVDGSVKENIAFGVPTELIDNEKVREAAKKAHLFDLIDGWPSKFDTFVGEQGVRLSGGQRQRIGIARALYKQADVLVFDEGTSALDNETESSVMEAIYGLSSELTVLLVAHRLTTLKHCDRIIELGDSVLRVRSYDEITKKKMELKC